MAEPEESAPTEIFVPPPRLADIVADAIFYNQMINNKPYAASWNLGEKVNTSSVWAAANPDLFPITENDNETEVNGVYIKAAKKAKTDLAEIKESQRIPPSVAKELVDICEKNFGSSGLPLYAPTTESLVIIDDAMSASIRAINDTKVKTDDGQPIDIRVELATFEHINSQLMWHRRSKNSPDKEVPLCMLSSGYKSKPGDAESGSSLPCAALELMRNQGPLHTFLSMKEEEVFQETGKSRHGMCYLCILRMVHSQVMAATSRMAPMRQFCRNVIPLPFRVLVNCPGGYNQEFCYTQSTIPVITANFPRFTGAYQVRHNPETNQYYVDQRFMGYGCEPVGMPSN